MPREDAASADKKPALCKERKKLILKVFDK